jgi:uncharacterized NAD(P)/FAD-binding protein YdhS
VLVCTGAGADVRRLSDPLVRSLVSAGQAVVDPLGLGFRLTDSRLHTLGPPRRGELWESTAIPEIRAQAEALAGQLCGALGVAIPITAALAAG